MHTEIEFSVEPKTTAGKGPARQLRATGQVPGIVYGPGMEPVMVAFREKELAKALSTPAARNVFLRVKSSDTRLDGSRVLVKDLQVHPLNRVFVHADFYKPDPAKVIHVTLPVRLEGQAAGVKLGGILQVTLRDIAVACLPDALPDALIVDVSDLKPGHSLHVRDLVAPEGVRLLADPRMTVCAVIGAGYQEDAVKSEEASATE